MSGDVVLEIAGLQVAYGGHRASRSARISALEAPPSPFLPLQGRERASQAVP